MIIFDTSVWVAFINAMDSQHARAVTALDDAISPVIIPEYVVVETCSVLTAKVNKAAAINFLDFISNNANCSLLFSYETWAGEVVEFFKTQAPGTLSYPDAALLYLARDYTVLTFDKQLERAIKKLKNA